MPATAADTVERLEKSRAPLERERDLVCLKTFRMMPDILVPNNTNEFRSWKLAILPTMTTFDGSRVLRSYLVDAMNVRGEHQLELKFQEHPLPQTMGILAGKLMNMSNVRHSTFGPMLETYSQECAANNVAPTAL